MMRSSSSSTVAELLEFQKNLGNGTLAGGYLRAAEPLAIQELIEAGSSRCGQLKELQELFPC